MFSSVPVLDIFFIDFDVQEESEKKKSSGIIKGAIIAKSAMAILGGPLTLFGGPITAMTATMAMKTLGADGASLKRIIEEKRFNIIKTEEELKLYENANGNSWVINEKTLKKRQYYIRHPKKNNQNILIEAQSFYDYIEKEQKKELIEFIMSSCPVKNIRIVRNEIVESGGNATANVKGLDLNGGGNYSQMKGDYYNYSNPNGTQKVEGRKNYLWIDESLMLSISMLTEGATLSQTYEYDSTFGLNAREAKTIGLDLSKHKKYLYTIQIEC